MLTVMTNKTTNNNMTKASLAIGLAATLFVFGVMLPVSNSQRVFAEGTFNYWVGSGEFVSVDDATLQCLQSSDAECTAQQQQQQEQQQPVTAEEEPQNDLNCADIQARDFQVDPANDTNGFDGDKDGIGCETGNNGQVTEPEQAPVATAEEPQQQANPYQAVIEQIVIAKAAIFNGDNADAINHLENALVLYDEVVVTQTPAETIPVIEVLPVQEEPAASEEQPAVATSNESQQQEGIAVGEPTPSGNVQVLGEAIFADQLNFESCGVLADCIAQIINCGVTFVVGSAIQTADNPQEVIDAVQANPEAVATAMNDTGVTSEVASVISDAVPNLVTNDTTPAEVTEDLAQIGQEHADEINDVIVEDVGSS